MELTLEQEFTQAVFEHKCKLIGYEFMAEIISHLREEGRENEIDTVTAGVPQFVLQTIIPDLINKGTFNSAYEQAWENLAESLA